MTPGTLAWDRFRGWTVAILAVEERLDEEGEPLTVYRVRCLGPGSLAAGISRGDVYEVDPCWLRPASRAYYPEPLTGDDTAHPF